jgi:hypothetical protein
VPGKPLPPFLLSSVLGTFADSVVIIQISIGWDTAKNSGANPQVTNHDIAPIKASRMGSGNCLKYNEVNSGKVFSQKPGGPLTETDNTPWQFCMGMSGQACKFGQS